MEEVWASARERERVMESEKPAVCRLSQT